MAIRRGRGVAAVNYPTGMNLGGDPSQALVHSTPTGNFMVTLSSRRSRPGAEADHGADLRRDDRRADRQVIIDTADTDTGPHCMGTFASRGTHRIGNAVIQAAKEARQVMLEVAAEELEVNASDLETDGKGNIHVKGAPQKSISIFDTALAAHFKRGRSISGRGMFLIPRSYPETETGAMKPSTCYAHACTVAEVEVDDETGEVTVLSVKNVFEIGRALNPKMVEQQLVGGSWMGISHALYETTEPYYPNRDHGGTDFNQYLMPGPGDLAETEIIVLERPAADGPYGAKGPGEMCANPQIPAIANAIFDAVGVRIDTLPITPERILRALKAQARELSADMRRRACRDCRDASPEALAQRLAAGALSGRRGPGDRDLPGHPAGQAAAARRRAGRRQDRGGQGDRRDRCGRDLVRLQCYEGIDAAHALYEWNYQRQLLAIRQAGEHGDRHL